MASTSTHLLGELKTLRKGRGIYAPKIQEQVGPAVRSVCAITDSDDPATVRQKLAGSLGDLARALPDDLGLAAAAALALHPDARHLFLRDRVQWLATRIRRDERTARRRVDEALERLAESLTSKVTPTAGKTDLTNGGWYVAEFHAVLRMDQPSPEALERRRIVAERDGIDHIEVLLSLPREPADGSSSHDLQVEVLYGGTLVCKEHETESKFRFVLELPHTLQAGDRHEYALIFRVPPNQPMRTHYVFVSTRRCDLFDLRVRFDPARPPHQLWRVFEVFHRQIDDMQPSGEILALDRSGEVHLQFHQLRPGLGYGAQWRAGPDIDQARVVRPADGGAAPSGRTDPRT
jgi:hypothetical protein